MHILLTNDDSHSSPLFQLAIEHLHSMGDLTIVVPNEEQSWTGKCITRFSPLYVDEILLGDRHAYGVSGTPADCVNLGIYHLMKDKPDLVVSGINIGRNTGMGFALSSGTIGACLEANIAGVPAVALSQDVDLETYRYWNRERTLRKESVDHFRAQNGRLLSRIFDYLLDGDHLDEPVTWNVNLPFHAVENCQLGRTFLGYSLYGSCFKKTGDRYHHDLETVTMDERENADGMVVLGGHVSITRIDTRVLGRV